MEDLHVMAVVFAAAPIVLVCAVFISRYRNRREQERLFAAFERAKAMKTREHSQI